MEKEKKEIKETKESEEKRALEITTEEIKKLNIFQKMDLARVYIGSVTKNIDIGYKATAETDVLKAVNEAERRARLISYPSSTTIVERGERAYGRGGNGLWVRVKVVITLVNIDNTEEKITFEGYGDGIDSGDKALGKACTYANKYALMKGYKIPTGDDPDYFLSEMQEYATEKDIKVWQDLIGEDKIKLAIESYGVKSLTEVPRETILERIKASRKIIEEQKKRKEIAKNG